MSAQERFYLPFVHVNPRSISIVPELVFGSNHSHQYETFEENFKSNKHHGKVSKIAARKISLAIDYLLYLAKYKQIPAGYSGAGKYFKINFVTLTLPSGQVHSDKHINAEIVSPMLNYLRKHYKLINYIWRAEKQKNGNLHFHLLTDVFIPHWDLRKSWNRYLQNLGYISRYREAQLHWHYNGFQVREDLLSHWTLEAQFSAYNRGFSEDWSNPNTTDIHSTKRVKNLKKYLCKYLTKNDNSLITDEEINNATVQSILTIDNRLWACSENISKGRGLKLEYTEEIQQEIDKICEHSEVQTVIGDHFSVFYIHISYLKRWNCLHLYNLFSDYCKLTFTS